MVSDDMLSEAIRLIKAEKRPEAQLLLEPFIQANPHNITAWMWEAELFLDDHDKVRVMEICLEHNPNHPQALKALAFLKSRAGITNDTRAELSPPPPVPVYPTPPQTKQAAPLASAKPAATSRPRIDTSQKPVIRRKHPDWPTVEGVVDHSQVRVMRGGYTPIYMAEITAFYLVNGKSYSIKHKHQKAGISPENAQLLVSSYPPGKAVTVSYHPRNPLRAWVDEWDVKATNKKLNEIKSRPDVQNELVSRYRSRMLTGLGWLVGGIIATALGTMLLSQFGYAYIAFTGAIVYGLIMFVSGLFGWLWNME